MARHARVLAAFRMGIIEWDETVNAYYLGDTDVTEAMHGLTFAAGVFGPCKLLDPRRDSGIKWIYS
jgi:hypothetical protein